ncbi:MAG: triose-phosphate isomerase [Gammaproteobacteria bacterium]|jgi:triosephosphate isomerase|nr:triose-phosphate isomerase [Gammaproteobacteria bacterium]
MRRPLVAGNWKMNGSRAQATALIGGLLQGISGKNSIEVVVCPPFVLIPLAAELMAVGNGLILGAQNLSTQSAGAYTGEVSAPMLTDYGCQYAIVGHSERRALYGESDAVVTQKFGVAIENNLTPILCVGETLAQREADETEKTVNDQLDAVLQQHGIEAMAKAVVAYEPVWAIGTGRTATPQQAQAVHHFIRNKLAVADKNVAANIRLLYGGSVKASNAADLFNETDIDGGLIGGASLDANEFIEICRAAVH